MSRWPDLVAALRLSFRAGPLRLLAYVGVTVIAAVVPVVVAWTTKLVLDALAGAGTDVAGPAVVLAVAGVLVVAVPHLLRHLGEEQERAVTLIATDELYAAVNRFVGLGRFEEPAFLDRLRLAQQTGGATPSHVVDGLLAVVRGALTVGGLLTALWLVGPLITLLVLASTVPVLLAELRLSHRRAAMLWRIGPLERRELFYGSLLTEVQAAKEVRLFGTGTFLRTRMRAERVAANHHQRVTSRHELLVQGGLGVLSAAVAGVGLVWAVRSAAAGELSVGDVALFVAALAAVQATLAAGVGDVARAHHQLVLFGHHRAVVAAEPDLPVPVRPTPVPALRRGIELRDVWFRYSPDHPWVLRGVSLFIPHGSAVGLVGLNGAGKSTLVRLLCRFHDPTQGAVLWDGVDLRDVDPTALRGRVSAVFQDHMNYDLTVAENIALGDLDALDHPDRIRAAAEVAGIDEMVRRLPRGYDTLLSRVYTDDPDDAADPDIGVTLSGGQWQRLAMARALLDRSGDLLILDEPASGLDADAEAAVHRTLNAHRAGRTSVLVSHRLGSLRDAELIVVLEDGRITERGSHHELVAEPGTYARLFALQAQGYVG